MRAVGLARFLGWFSIALGTTQLLFGSSLARQLGLPRRGGLMRGLGAREVATGAAILYCPAAAGPLWARVGGDVMDLAILGRASTFGRRERRNVGLAVGAVVGITVLDLLCAAALTRNRH
ncbi:hypothetical protein [Roseomonas elaeocarpi]|uniref:Uncharacterized protein n=1 Tax=Roseomonas elaeocarpi TaxID=907779 RepID=A0ABV6JRD5_9PROT